MGIFMEERGDDSWGWTDGKQIVKAVGLFRNGFNCSMLGFPSAVVHTRLGTTGAKTAANSHPFEIKGIIGVHNGMIYNHKAAAEKHGIEYTVDSELIFHYIADKLPMNELQGYGTIVFYRDGKLHMGRFNTRGDLVVAKTDMGWIYASEKEAIQNAEAIAGFVVQEYIEPELGKLFVVEGDQLVATDQDMTLDTTKPAAKTDWRDFRGTSNYSGGYSGYNLNDSYWSSIKKEWGQWEQSKSTGEWEWTPDEAKNKRLGGPLPTAETTTFTAEPSSDEDEVIDVGEGEYVGDPYSAAAIAEMRRKGILDDTDDDTPLDHEYFVWKNWYSCTADLSFIRGWGQCSECGLTLDGEDEVYVQQRTKDVICDDCFFELVDFESDGEPADADRVPTDAELAEMGVLFADQINDDIDVLPVN